MKKVVLFIFSLFIVLCSFAKDHKGARGTLLLAGKSSTYNIVIEEITPESVSYYLYLGSGDYTNSKLFTNKASEVYSIQMEDGDTYKYKNHQLVNIDEEKRIAEERGRQQKEQSIRRAEELARQQALAQRLLSPKQISMMTCFTESSLKRVIEAQDDGIVGIYEGVTGAKYKLGCVRMEGQYKLINLSVVDGKWSVGDVKAVLRETATRGMFIADWYMRDKSLKSGAVVTFDGSFMKLILDGEDVFIKMFPTANSEQTQSSVVSRSWTGTAFALNDGYLATNNHCVEGNSSIKIKGINQDFNKEYDAEVVATDKINDLAILKISDPRGAQWGKVPYSLASSMCNIGDPVWALGYPMTNIMGEEIKYTDGSISSKSGIQGDLSVYQITVPIQPGNSGGALFDNKGNVVGVTSSGLNRNLGTENVNYAIKATYLRNLVESALSTNILPNGTKMQTLKATDQILLAKNYVFLLIGKSATNGLYPRVIEAPICTKESSKFTVKEVTLNNDYTIIDCAVNNPYSNDYLSISRQSYIKDNEGNSYDILFTENMAFDPHICKAVSFRLYFPKLAPDMTSILINLGEEKVRLEL